MPDSARSWPNLVRFCLALFLAIAAPGYSAQAANDARISPERAEVSALFLFSMGDGGGSLTGFDCDVIPDPGPNRREFTADPDYSETPFTVGLEVFLDDANAPPARLSGRLKIDDGSAADARTPLSARLSAIIVQNKTPPLAGGGKMEDVFVPEASKSVADLAALCMP